MLSLKQNTYLLSGENETLLIGRDSLLILNLLLDALNCVRGLYIQGNRLSSKCLYENLHILSQKLTLFSKSFFLIRKCLLRGQGGGKVYSTRIVYYCCNYQKYVEREIHLLSKFQFLREKARSLNTTTMNSSKNSSTKNTRVERHRMHPLVRFDPDALKYIDVIELEYFEDPRTIAPVPRNQDLPHYAKTELTKRSLLVSTSHAWFHQCHPDPDGVKLKLIKTQFAPRLRKQYPHTKIVIFDDWHSCPQYPRNTQSEKEKFQNAMNHMNSMYVYCDVVLFLDTNLPNIDNTIYKCTLNPSEYDWIYFIDTIQFQSLIPTNNSSDISIRKNDIILSIENMDDMSKLKIDTLIHLNRMVTITFLKRPFGRPNRTLPDDRGWLFAERVTLAIRMAAAPPSQFDDVVLSNNEKLRNEIYKWSEKTRSAARRGKIEKQLKEFKSILKTKMFTFPDQVCTSFFCKITMFLYLLTTLIQT